MFTDPYTHFSRNYSKAAALTTHNTNPLPTVPNEIYIGVGGDLTVRPEGSAADVTFKNLIGGTTIWLRVTHIRTTGTTAASFVGLFE